MPKVQLSGRNYHIVIPKPLAKAMEIGKGTEMEFKVVGKGRLELIKV